MPRDETSLEWKTRSFSPLQQHSFCLQGSEIFKSTNHVFFKKNRIYPLKSWQEHIISYPCTLTWILCLHRCFLEKFHVFSTMINHINKQTLILINILTLVESIAVSKDSIQCKFVTLYIDLEYFIYHTVYVVIIYMSVYATELRFPTFI